MNITCMNEIITIIAQIPGRSQGVLFFQNEIGARLGRIVMGSSFINSFSCKNIQIMQKCYLQLFSNRWDNRNSEMPHMMIMLSMTIYCWTIVYLLIMEFKPMNLKWIVLKFFFSFCVCFFFLRLKKNGTIYNSVQKVVMLMVWDKYS